ncbi:ABC transporter ATP-binding protein [Sporosarcina sp. Marseille-Q4063]|uniref:ABC transporter ATP-binding protein n=1 Tax=Sporosarcina sp. Marseille-Q4063 TaxID=2810514 RepID=UPI001BAF5FCE|nr:ABC transporter ATP-binding protein [Sporosarcina sp. Marseille-Q4063]QUW23643.1 ABC transporter ATP-binding protein [Sporosarcina sp. Marseille-Q4063]
MENIIEVESLEKIFANQTALEDVNFHVKKGEIFGFLGPSGSGKTTTIKILTGQLNETSGKATVFGEPVSGMKKGESRKKIGVLTDNSGLYGRLSIYNNLKLYCELYEVPLKRIDEVLAIVNLGNEKKKVVSKLSKGMLQRVILARTLLHKPTLLFLDEPTSALDPVNSQHIHNGLRELNARGTTIFLTTHDMNEAELLCDRVAFLNKGKIRLMDEPGKLRKQYSDSTVTVELKDDEKVVIKTTAEGAQQMFDYMSSNNVVAIHSNEPTLGDIFVEVTGRKLS